MRHGIAWMVVVALALAALAGCTQGTACDGDHPCPDGWSCLDGQCGIETPLPICDGGTCTCTCERGPETGELNAGDCPPLEHFVQCSQGRDTDEMVCGGGGKPPELDCDTDADCASATAIEWM